MTSSPGTSSPGRATAGPLRPRDVAGVREALLDTAGPVEIRGAGTAAGWAGRLGPVDAVLDTTGLTGVITHNPGDMTVSVRAGTPLRALAEELAPHSQHVSLDAARIADGATVGGLLATADAGPAALVYGSLRDLVIGVTLVLADGTIAHSGGHVIKNVAGFDLAKLVHGSYGTLAVVAEVVLRLHPVPKGTATVELPCALADAPDHAARVLGGPFEPTALEWIGDSAVDGTLLIRLDGTPTALATRLAHLRSTLPAPETDGRHSRPDGGDAGADRSTQVWERHAAAVRGRAGATVVRVGCLPSALPGVLAALPGATSITAGLGTGVATVSVDPAVVAEVHAAVHAAGGTSMVRSRPDHADLPAWGPAPSAIAVLRAVKTALDPLGRFGPGRFDPWM